MTDADLIAEVRDAYPPHNMTEILAVCDLAERYLEAEDGRRRAEAERLRLHKLLMKYGISPLEGWQG